MILYRRILFGIVVISSFLVALAFLSAQYILANNYQQLEAANATQNIERAANVLQSDIDSINIDEIVWLEAPSPPPRYVPQNPVPNNAYKDFFSKISLTTKLNVFFLLDRENNIVFRSAGDIETEETNPNPETIIASLKPGNPLVTGGSSSTVIKGIVALPEGLLMAFSVPFYPSDRHDKNWGRLIAGRYIDEDEIRRITDSTKLNVELMAYNNAQLPSEFQTAKMRLDEGHRIYVDTDSRTVVSSYTVMNDIYGRPALILRAQTPRSIYEHGQESINSFLAALIFIVFLFGSALFLFLERTVLSRLSILNTGLTQMRAANNLTLEVPTSGQDEIANLTSSVKLILKDYAQTRSRLEDTQTHFDQRVLDRTAELSTTNSQLEQAINEQKQAYQTLVQTRDKAVSDLQLKSQLLTNVSHDSRTPLTIINLNAEMLQQGRHGALNSKQNEVLDRILNASRQLLNFVSNMLDEAQLKHGKMSFVSVSFEPKLLIEEFVSMLEPLAEAKGINLKAEIDLALPGQIQGDPDRFKQILTNLTENAIKFTNEGSVTIRALRTDSDHWFIQVADTGCGIPPEAQSRIFEAYWQLNSTSKQDTQRGVGLGLSIVKQIVQLMNGSISVESEVGQGTTFTVTLPIVRNQDNTVTKPVHRVQV